MSRVEHSRKHGPFDSRYPPIRHKPTPASLWRLGEERLDWQGFLGRLFPDSRRHDFDASALASSPGAVHADRSDKTQRRKD